jgi:hypothetical protein
MKISIVVPVSGLGVQVVEMVDKLSSILSNTPSECYIVLVDSNGFDDTPMHIMSAMPSWTNVEYIGISGSMDSEEAFLAGMENSPPSDAVILFDPKRDNHEFLSDLIQKLNSGADLVMVRQRNGSDGFGYRLGKKAFMALGKLFGDSVIQAPACRFRGMSRRVVSHVTAHDDAAIAHRFIPFMTGFRAEEVGNDKEYTTLIPHDERRGISDGIRRGLSLMTVTSETPLRLTSGLCILSAFASLFFSAYVAAVYFFRDEVAPGWTTLSLQLNALFFMLSMSVFALSEYVLSLGRKGRRGYRLIATHSSGKSTIRDVINVVQVEK